MKRRKNHLVLLQIYLKENNINSIVNTTDPDREGELIFSTLYSYLECIKPSLRLILKDMTAESIKEQ